MKPLNLDNRPCSPISSNCVIWQGPDIPCIKLCTGDTISDITFKLATELCAIMDQLNVSNYDLTCLGISACPPQDFQALIQLLINKICELNNIPVTETKSAGCPDCVVSVAECFVQGTQTTMQLVEYVQMIANRICNILDQLNIINNQITNLDNRVTVLENAPAPTFTLPNIDTNCLSTYLTAPYTNLTQAPIDAILNTLVNNSTIGYCALIEATGMPADVNAAVLTQCITDLDQSLAALTLSPPVVTTFSAYYAGTWVNSGTLGTEPTIANAINNIWISICDIYTYVSTLALVVQDTNSIDLSYSGGVLSSKIVDSGWVDLDGFNFYVGTMASNKPQCRRIGNQIHFRGEVYIPIDNGSGAIVALSSQNGYNGTYRATPFVGTGGIAYDAEGRILLNSNGGGPASVIPTSVVDAGTNLDNSYFAQQLVARRKLTVETFTGSGVVGSVLLNAAVNVAILSNKTLRIAPLNNIEAETGDAVSFNGNSLLRSLTSSFTPGSRIINFRNYVRQLDGNMSINQSPLNGLSGTNLVIGQLYRIVNYTAGDNFTNVGAVANANNQVFIATGAIPTVWTTSRVIPLSSGLFYDSFFNNVAPGYSGAEWPGMVGLGASDFDAGRPTNLGGFIVRLDGLVAYLDPCNTDIKTYPCL